MHDLGVSGFRVSRVSGLRVLGRIRVAEGVGWCGDSAFRGSGIGVLGFLPVGEELEAAECGSLELEAF